MRLALGDGAVRWIACGPLAAALITAAARAGADEPPPSPFVQVTDDSDPPRPPAAPLQTLKRMPPGYFNGLGSYHRTWGAQIDTSFDTSRVLTSRLELSRAISIWAPIAIVLRANVGFALGVGSDAYAVKGLIASVGLRNQTYQSRYWVEFGLRLVPPWYGPREGEPSGQAIALGATFSSGLADDARWLPFTDTGFQIYGAIQNRSRDFGAPGWQFYAGALYGGQASLGSMKVRTWLGPQSGFIGNAYVDIFLGLLRLGNVDMNLQVGTHAEVSLSTIWPADRPFPAVLGGFVGWSPEYWFASRLFCGVAGSPGFTKADVQYGFRLEFFVP